MMFKRFRLGSVELGCFRHCVYVWYDGDSSYSLFSGMFYLLPSMVEHWWAKRCSIFGLKDTPAWWLLLSVLPAVVVMFLFLFSLFTAIYTQASGMSSTTFRLYKFFLCVEPLRVQSTNDKFSVWDWFDESTTAPEFT